MTIISNNNDGNDENNFGTRYFVTQFVHKVYVFKILSKKAKKQQTPKGKEKRKLEDNKDLAFTPQSVSKNFGMIFHDMNVHLTIMANAWSHVEKKRGEQKLDDKNSKVLEEVMKLKGISPSEALEVTTILMAKEHRLQVFYQAHPSLRKQYMFDLFKNVQLQGDQRHGALFCWMIVLYQYFGKNIMFFELLDGRLFCYFG